MSTVLIFHSNYESVKMETEPSRKFRRFPASCKKSHLVVPYINSVKRNNTNQFYQILIFFFFNFLHHIRYKNFRTFLRNIPGGDEIFRPSRPATGPTQPPLQWVRGLSWGYRRPGRGADPPPHLVPRSQKE